MPAKTRSRKSRQRVQWHASDDGTLNRAMFVQTDRYCPACGRPRVWEDTTAYNYEFCGSCGAVYDFNMAPRAAAMLGPETQEISRQLRRASSQLQAAEKGAAS